MDTNGKHARHSRHYILKNLILLDEIAEKIRAMKTSSGNQEWDEIKAEEIVEDIELIKGNQIQAINAAFEQNHTIPVTR